MPTTYRKIDAETLEVTEVTNRRSLTTEEDRAEIQTKIDHYTADIAEIQAKKDAELAKIAILDA